MIITYYYEELRQGRGSCFVEIINKKKMGNERME